MGKFEQLFEKTMKKVIKSSVKGRLNESSTLPFIDYLDYRDFSDEQKLAKRKEEIEHAKKYGYTLIDPDDRSTWPEMEPCDDGENKEKSKNKILHVGLIRGINLSDCHGSIGHLYVGNDSSIFVSGPSCSAVIRHGDNEKGVGSVYWKPTVNKSIGGNKKSLGDFSKYDLEFNSKTGRYDSDDNFNLPKELVKNGSVIIPLGVIDGDFNCGEMKALTKWDGNMPALVKGDIDCSDCGGEFTKEEVEKVTKYEGHLFDDELFDQERDSYSRSTAEGDPETIEEYDPDWKDNVKRNM